MPVLTRESIVYSGGVGRDVTFENELVQRVGCRVLLFDPSPTGVATMAQAENQIDEFKFNPVALANHSGSISMSPPLDAREGSWFSQASRAATIQVPCRNLSTLMHENAHERIDLLKLDIEGGEYEVLDDILERRISIRQICVEFHHGTLPGIRRSQTVRAILRLIAHGYKLLCQEGNNHTFLRAGRWP